MSVKKSVGFVSLAALAGALIYGCSSSSDSPAGTGGDDAGGHVDASGGTDGASDALVKLDSKAEAAAQCQPADVSGFMPPAYVPAHRQPGVCTAQQITDFYSHCFDTTRTKAACDADKAAAPACTTCLEVPSTTATWGATYTHNGVVTVNVAGCMELLGGPDGLACAKKSQAATACDDAACSASCPVTDDASFQLYLACIQQSAANGCSTQNTAVQTCEQQLNMGDGGAVQCFGGQNFQDIYNAIAPIFCGGATTGDAGPG